MRKPSSLRAPLRAGLIDGLVLSLPVGTMVVATQLTASPRAAQLGAIAAALLAVPWVVPAWVAIAALSSPLYVWLVLHEQPLDVMRWLGGAVLVAAVVGSHVNGVLLVRGWCARHRRGAPQDGLGKFLRRTAH